MIIQRLSQSWMGLLWTVCIPVCFFALAANAQQASSDSSQTDSMRIVQMDPVIVTATRSEKILEDVAVPTSIITVDVMEREGALRLGDVLANQMGIALFDDHGTGMQVQGFASDYTLVLLDGEPMIGRTAGTLDVDRISVKGLSHLEIVRGPSSSLYGSEALAGVVNLVTAPPAESMQGAASFRIGSHATSDMMLQMEGGLKRTGLRLVLNRYASGGYDLTPATYGPTTPSFADWTVDLRSRFVISDRIRVRLGARGALENQESVFASGTNEFLEERYDDEGRRLEWSIHPEIELQLSSKFRLNTTLYGTGYQTETYHRRQNDGALNYEDKFDQTLVKAEMQLDMLWGAKHMTNLGGGVIGEQIGGSRYGATRGDSGPESTQSYLFAQHEWYPSGLLHFNTSIRFDHHSDYTGRVTPKFAVLIRPSDKIRLRASVGSGFKAPAFRQLYLSFTNPAGGYSVFGSLPMLAGIRRLEAEGQIEQKFFDLSKMDPLRAESSIAFNLGGSIEPFKWLHVQANVFHNNVRDLIETQPVAQKTNGAFVYGYFNLARIYTRGIELETKIQSHLTSNALVDITLGYQFLQARDREVVSALKEGTVFGRYSNGRDYRLRLGDYTGMFGRSPHSASLRAAYTNTTAGVIASIHGRWRSRYGYRDLDGNNLANRSDEFVPDYAVLGVAVTKTFSLVRAVEAAVQIGLDNAFDHTYPTLVPSLPGRRGYVSVQFNF
ncbi:MAG: TonB-dependent receptor [Bacteroidetes bacterium]|nr:TonB-dependent receptor [Bacteroidota bacterium]MCY4205173.1 TonB-dependent receptor [Bacteroidota bacterium]